MSLPAKGWFASNTNISSVSSIIVTKSIDPSGCCNCNCCPIVGDKSLGRASFFIFDISSFV